MEATLDWISNYHTLSKQGKLSFKNDLKDCYNFHDIKKKKFWSGVFLLN